MFVLSSQKKINRKFHELPRKKGLGRIIEIGTVTPPASDSSRELELDP